MPRNDFISDNLVNMRERFRQNAAAGNSTASSTGPDAPQPENTAPVLPAPPAAPTSGNTGRDDERERVRRDLEGRILRDLAAARAELARLAGRREELSRFEQELAREWEEFRRLTPGSAEYAGQLDRLRIEYFRQTGGVSALLVPAMPAAGAAADSAPSTFRRRAAETLPLTLAILFAALIVAAAIILTFRV